MRQLPIAGGSILIGDDEVEIDTSIGRSFLNFWKHNKIGVMVLTLGLVFIVATAVRGSTFSRILVLLIPASLIAYFGVALAINKIYRPNITTDTIIPRSAIKAVVYKKGSKVQRPTFAFIYMVDEEQKGRNVFLLPEWMGEDAPLERILPVLEEEGIETKSVEEVDAS